MNYTKYLLTFLIILSVSSPSVSNEKKSVELVLNKFSSNFFVKGNIAEAVKYFSPTIELPDEVRSLESKDLDETLNMIMFLGVEFFIESLKIENSSALAVVIVEKPHPAAMLMHYGTIGYKVNDSSDINDKTTLKYIKENNVPKLIKKYEFYLEIENEKWVITKKPLLVDIIGV